MTQPRGQTNEVTTRRVEVFRPGTFKAMNGQQYSFSSQDVEAMVSGYDPEGAPAPVVVGHPKHDDPAFGWAKGFSVNGEGTLVAEIGDLAPEFVEAVEAGRYRKISMKFFAPDAPNNPAPGTYYPRHIGFLGGAAPAVSGLAPVQFVDGDDDELIEIALAEQAFEEVGGIFRKMREFFIEQFSREAADQAIPEYMIRWIEDAAEEPKTPEPGFTQPDPEPEEEPAMSGDDTSARVAELDERERKLAEQEAVAFADQLVSKGQLLPAQRDGVVALLGALSVGQPAEISFSDDGKDAKMAPADILRSVLNAQPEIVPMGETDLGEDPANSSPAFAGLDGLAVDADGLQLHAKAIAYQKQHPGTDYIDAVQAVEEA